jgi:hypothetical protein
MLAVVRMLVGCASAKLRWIMPVASLNRSSDQTQETRVLDIELVFFAPPGVARNQGPNPLVYTCDKQSVWEINTL